MRAAPFAGAVGATLTGEPRQINPDQAVRRVAELL
jgi:hypothetical protein